MQIALLIFAFLTIVGAFSGWRKSPLYSLKISLKLVGTFLLIVAVIVGASLAIVHGLSRWPVAQGIAGFLTIIMLTSGFSIFIVRITDAHVAQLPQSAKLVTFNRHKTYQWIWRLVVFLLIDTTAALVCFHPAGIGCQSGLGGFMLLLCVPMLSIFYMMARRNDRSMSAVIANPWAHWQYTPEKWVQWANNQREWEEAQEGLWSWKKTLLFVLFCGVLFALGALFTGASMQENVVIVGGLTGFIILLALVAYWFKRTNFDRRYRRLLAAAPEAYFGDEGMFCNGAYTPWILSGKYLLKATAASDPPARVTLIFQSSNGSSSALVTQRIPIPDGHISDLPVLQRKLNAHCPTASVHLAAS